MFEWIAIALISFEATEISKRERRILVDILYVIVEKLENQIDETPEFYSAVKLIGNSTILTAIQEAKKEKDASLFTILIDDLMIKINSLKKKVLKGSSGIINKVSEAFKDLENLNLEHALIEQISSDELIQKEISARNEIKLEVPTHKKFDVQNYVDLKLDPLFESYEITISENKKSEDAEEETK